MPNEYPPLLTTRQAAAYLQLSPATLETWRSRGGGPRYTKVGKRAVRYTLQHLVDWITEHQRHHTSDPGTSSPVTS